MVNVILNCDLDLAKELSEIEKEIFSTSWIHLGLEIASIIKKLSTG